MGKVLSFLVATVMAFAIAMTPASNVNAATAGVDMVAACQLMYQAAWKVEVVVVEYNVMGWKCMINGYSYKLDINVAAWCRHKYGKSAQAKYYDFNNPYTWYCQY